ncbi:MAG: hypothetical protein ACP5MG_09920 [Verrucomicrobiia bacterium]
MPLFRYKIFATIRRLSDKPMGLMLALLIFAISGIFFCGCKTGSNKSLQGKIGATNSPSSETLFVTSEPKKLTYQDIVRRFDKNKDGVLDDEEIADMQKQLGSRPATFSSTTADDQTIKRAGIITVKPGGSTTGDPIIDKYDLNHDGIIDETEAELLKKDLRGEGAPELKKPTKPKQSQSPTVITPIMKPPRRPLVR